MTNFSPQNQLSYFRFWKAPPNLSPVPQSGAHFSQLKIFISLPRLRTSGCA